MRRIATLALAALLPLTSVAVVAAKGESHVTRATIAGGVLTEPVTFAWQDSAIGVYVEVPYYQSGQQTIRDQMSNLAASGRQPIAGELPYSVVLHYDFDGDRREWAGHFDGTDTLYFPHAMVVGSGVWAAGWYKATPGFANQLAEEIVWAQMPAELQKFRPQGAWQKFRVPIIGLTLATLFIFGRQLRGVRGASASPALIHQRLLARDAAGDQFP